MDVLAADDDTQLPIGQSLMDVLAADDTQLSIGQSMVEFVSFPSSREANL